jgi:hypothetical protein
VPYSKIMQRFIINVLLPIVLLLSVFSCEYEPSGENFRDIARPDTTRHIQVNLSPLETQYSITVPTNILYDLNTFGLKIYNVEFLLEGKSLYKGNKATGVFWFDPALYGTGAKTLTMKVTTNTETGSLADLTGVEALIYEKSWNLLLDGGNPDPVEITRIYNDNGVLRIEWGPYKRFNFQKFTLYKNFGDAEATYERHIIAEITNQDQNYFSDQSFIGGTAIYWIEVQASNHSAISNQKKFTFEYTNLDTLWVKGDSAKFTWHKNPFYTSVNEFKLTAENSFPGLPVEIFTSKNSTDTSFIATGLRFGKLLQYTLSTFPLRNIRINNDNQVLKSFVSFGIGKSIPKSTKMIGSPFENHMFLYDGEKLSKLDISSKTVVSSQLRSLFSIWFISSFDGDLYTLVYSKLTKYKKDNLNDYTEFDSAPMLGYNWFWANSISSQNRMLGAIPTGTGLYDWNSSTFIFKQNAYIENAILSPDGKYAFNTKYMGYADKEMINIFEVTETGLIKTGQLPENVYGQKIWIPGKGHQLFILTGSENDFNGQRAYNTASILDANSMKNESEFQVKVGHLTNLDNLTRQVAFWDNYPGTDNKRKLYIYSFENGKLIKEINLAPRFDLMYIIHSNVLSGNGYCLDYSNL